jgi:hypothetical protein
MLVGNPSLPAERCYGVPSDCFGSALCEVKLRIAFRRAHREGDRRRAMSCTACGQRRALQIATCYITSSSARWAVFFLDTAQL